MKLLERAFEAIPAIYDLAISEIQVGLRPGSYDHSPIIGKSEIAGLYYATGHYRHGILLTPITAYEMTNLILKEKLSDIVTPFLPGRFSRSLRS
jgi:glycine oxidase